MTVINAVWIGPRMGKIHAACLRSFVRQGYRTVLHVYETPEDVPDGVQLSDANRLLPESRIIRHRKTGSPALTADFLRYEIQRNGLGLYVDCDVYCLRRVEPEEYMFGRETTTGINNAVLHMPKDCPALAHLAEIKDMKPFLPEWVSSWRRNYYKFRACTGFPVKVQNMTWGVTGPKALTWFVKKYGLEAHAAPIDVFYPVHPEQVALLLEPDLSLADITTPRTVFLHLYHEMLKRIDLTEIPKTSPLGQILSA